jgi:hypothetical protein
MRKFLQIGVIATARTWTNLAADLDPARPNALTSGLREIYGVGHEVYRYRL